MHLSELESEQDAVSQLPAPSVSSRTYDILFFFCDTWNTVLAGFVLLVYTKEYHFLYLSTVLCHTHVDFTLWLEFYTLL